MAFATKFRIESTSDIYGKITVNIKQDNYNGPITELSAAGRDWIKLSIGSNTQDITDVVLSSNLSFSFYCLNDFTTIELANSEPFTYLVEVVDSIGVIWTGWVRPEEYEEAYHATPYVATVSASDGLEELKNFPYDLTGGKDSLIIQINRALALTGLSLNIRESINIYSNAMTSVNAASPLVQASVRNATFQDIGQNVTYYDVLVAILRPFLARLYQYRGWNIENIQGKRSSYVERIISPASVVLSSTNRNPLVTLDNDPQDFKAFLNKTGYLKFRPSINNAEVFFNTSQPDPTPTLRGFSLGTDWVNINTLQDWNRFNNVPLSQQTVNFQGNQFAARITGRNTGFSANQYIESIGIPVDQSTFRGFSFGFNYWMNYPSVIILGSRPILFVEVVLFSSDTASVFFWNNGWYTERRQLRIDAPGRQVWRRWDTNIDNVPENGNIRIRLHRLVKAGSDTNTEVRFTGFTSNLVREATADDIVLKEIGRSSINTTYTGPSFQHWVSDGEVLDRSGVLDVNNVLTTSWNRRGFTDNLNLRRLFMLQWLSLHQKPLAILSGTLHIKGEKVTPISVIKDADSVSTTRYIFASWDFGLASGIGEINYREIPLNDATVVFTEEFVTSQDIENVFPDFTQPSPIGTFVPSFDNQAPTFTIPPVNGDVRGDINTTELTPSAIVAKPTLSYSGLISSRVAINAVEDSENTEQMTKTSAKDLFNAWAVKTTPVGADSIVITDSQDSNELKRIAISSLQTDPNKVSYNQADNRTPAEQAQARTNIDVYSKAEVKDITGLRVNLNTSGKDNLVQAINESNTWTQIEW